MLDSKGLDPEQYMWNLWPRWDGIPFSDPQISDFAPDDHNAVVIRSKKSAIRWRLPADLCWTPWRGPGRSRISRDVHRYGFPLLRNDAGAYRNHAASFLRVGSGSRSWSDNGGLCATGLAEIMFDLVVVVRPGGDSLVNDLNAGIRTALPAANISINGNSIVARVPLRCWTRKAYPGTVQVEFVAALGWNPV